MNSGESLVSRTSTIVAFDEIYTEEDSDAVVYSIREDLIERVMKHIDHLYFRDQLVKFLADCSQDALKKLISIQFYHHNESANLEKNWTCDKPLPPSEPDTWTSKRVPIVEDKPSEISVDTIKYSTTSDDFVYCTCNIGVDCLCYKKQEERIQKALEALYSRNSQPSTKPASAADKKSFVEDTDDFDEEESDFQPEATIPLECTMPGFSKIPQKKQSLLPKIEIAGPIQSTASGSELMELPPIRVDAKFSSKPVDPLGISKSRLQIKKD